MNRTCLALALCLPALTVQAEAPKKPQAKRMTVHKAKVPVTVTTVFGDQKATLTLKFNQPVEEAAIGVRGLDGMTVSPLAPLQKTTFAKGEVFVLEVPFVAGPGRSHLALDLEGRFLGQRRMGVFTFGLGKLSADQLKANQAPILTTESGQRVKVMPLKPD